MDSDGQNPGGSLKTPPAPIAPGAPAETPLPAIAAKADDLEEIKKAVEDAASVSGGLWLSYLFVLVYVAIAAGAVTHEDLLLIRPVKLPFLNVELPLKAFFALAPFVVLIIHAYALMHFRMLGNKASRFHNELRRQFPAEGGNKEIRDKLRRLLPSNIFVQILAGPPELRRGVFGAMLKLIAFTTLVAFPVLVLLLLQIQFLPFHEVTVTWAQRDALCLDIVLLWLLLWRPILGDVPSAEISGRARLFIWALRGFGLVLAGVTSILALWFSIVVATIPNEWQRIKLARLDLPLWHITEYGNEQLVSIHHLLFAGVVDNTTRRRKSLFSNTLVLPGFNIYEALKIDDPKKLAWKEHLIDLRGRHLEQAVLNGADLSKADLYGAQLQGTWLIWARLQGASLDQAQLEGARLHYAQLQDASLVGAQLRGAWLYQAGLQGASLDNAQLQGAALWGAQLQGASLFEAGLQDASLDNAQLQGARLEGAQLQGASLDQAQLQGAALYGAQLQGASLDGAKVNATEFSGAFLWRTNWGKIEPAKLGTVRLKDVTWKPVWRPVDSARTSDPVPWDAKAYAELRFSMNSIPEGERRDEALKQIEKLDCGNPDKTLASCDPATAPPSEVLGWQEELKAATLDDTTFEKAVATELRGLICASDDNAIHILRSIIIRETIREAIIGSIVSLKWDCLNGPAAKPPRSWISS
jgi:uncharacterized protein YjbI with pentapeptide repeats